MKKLKNSKGFTLMEMLIVVAIIAILVAIAIPTFTNQLEKAREAADLANLRSAYAEVIAASLTDATPEANTGVTKDDTAGAGKYTWTKTVEASKQKSTWISGSAPKIGEVQLPATAQTKGSSWTVTYSEATATASITPTTTP